jgi:hypothetical protein
MAKRGLERVSVATGLPGAEGNQYTFDAQLSKDGRWAVFSSAADNLIGPGADNNVALDVFVRDRLNGTTNAREPRRGWERGLRARHGRGRRRVRVDLGRRALRRLHGVHEQHRRGRHQHVLLRAVRGHLPPRPGY